MSAVNERTRQRGQNQDHLKKLLQAEQLLAQGALKECAALCQEVLAENEECASAYYLMSEVFRQLGQREKALQFNEFALRFQPDSPDVYLQRGKLCFALGQWDDAEKAFHNAHRLNPNNALALMLKGDAQAERGDFAAAMRSFEQAVAIDDSPMIREHKGLCQILQGDDDGARATFRELVRHQPGYAPTYVHLAKMLIDDDEEEAEKLLQKALMLDPMHCEALAYSCKIAFQQQNMPLAIDYARQVPQANPRALVPNLIAVEPLRQSGLYGEAEVILRRLVEVYPYNPQLILYLAPLLVVMNKQDEALVLIERGLSLDPDNPSMKYILASLTGEAADAAPEDYVTTVFDNYANNFDAHLQDVLQYRTPQLIAAAVEAVMPAGRSDYSLLDLGCGTGLAAEALRSVTGVRVGVDLSGKMVEQALAKGVYTEAHVDELVRYMQSDARQYDLVVAADVLVYIGKLEPLFEMAAKRLAVGGAFALSVERDDVPEARFTLRPSGRYAHSDAYIRQVAAQYGMRVVTEQVHALRKEGHATIEGTLFVLQHA